MAEVPEVEEIPGEHFRFHVISRTEPSQKYLVDLEGYRFNGWCGCERFKFACEPKLSRGATPGDVFRCWHIRRARSYFMDIIFPKLAAAFHGQQNPTKPLDAAKTILSGLDLGELMAILRLTEKLIEEQYERAAETTTATTEEADG